MMSADAQNFRARLKQAAQILRSAQEVIAQEEAQEAQKRAAARAHLVPGALIEGKGVYLKTLEPKDADGKSLGAVFDVYAAPQDVPDASGGRLCATYTNMALSVSSLDNFHGHDGAFYPTWRETQRALLDGTYRGGWVIPPEPVQYDQQPGALAGANTLKALQHAGALKGTFFKVAEDSRQYAGYWTSTPAFDDAASHVHATDMGKHGDIIEHVGTTPHHCRPVRFERVK